MAKAVQKMFIHVKFIVMGERRLYERFKFNKVITQGRNKNLDKVDPKEPNNKRT